MAQNYDNWVIVRKPNDESQKTNAIIFQNLRPINGTYSVKTIEYRIDETGKPLSTPISTCSRWAKNEIENRMKKRRETGEIIDEFSLTNEKRIKDYIKNFPGLETNLAFHI